MPAFLVCQAAASKCIPWKPLAATVATMKRALPPSLLQTSLAMRILLILPFCRRELILEHKSQASAMAVTMRDMGLLDRLPIDVLSSESSQKQRWPFWSTLRERFPRKVAVDQKVLTSPHAGQSDVARYGVYSAPQLQIYDCSQQCLSLCPVRRDRIGWR